MKRSWLWLVIVGALVIGVVLFTFLTPKKVAEAPVTDIESNQLTLHTSQFPKSFNAYVNNSTDASQAFDLVYATLLELDTNTLEYQPLIADSCTISPDKKEFLIKLSPLAQWSDGTSITAADVKFTYDTIMDPANLTSVMRLYFGRLNPPQIIDERTVKFTAKTVHYKNFEVIAGFNILPKHLFEGADFNKAFNMSLPEGSGPYNLTEVKEGRYYVFTRKQNYWADQLPHRKQTYNFDKIKIKVMNADVAFEAFKRGDFDIFDSITAKRWVEDTKSEHFQKNWIVKRKIYNYAPRGFQGLALNMRKPIFQDLNVRQALVHLLNREQILAKIMYNEYQPLSSYWSSLYEQGEIVNPELAYDPQLAVELLRQVGYTKLDQEGYLKNEAGNRLEFTISYVNQESERFLTVFAEDCKQAGVKVNLKRMSWATLIKEMDQYNFDAVIIAWSGTLFADPEQLWHSRHAAEVGGSNLSGYQNAKVDQLIDSLPSIFEVSKRNKIIKRIDQMIYEEVPYILFWEANYSRVFYKNIFGMPETVFSKYSSDIIKYWWFDDAKAAAYQQAVKEKTALPEESVEVLYP